MWGVDVDVVCTGIAPIVTILMSMAKVITSSIFQSKVLIKLLHSNKFIDDSKLPDRKYKQNSNEFRN